MERRDLLAATEALPFLGFNYVSLTSGELPVTTSWVEQDRPGSDDLFGAEQGIYTHALERGEKWERPVSVELIAGDGTTAFQGDAGGRRHRGVPQSGNATRLGPMACAKRTRTEEFFGR